MPELTYEYLRSLKDVGTPFSYDERDSMLYALGVGMGRDPLDEAELQYLFEGRELRVIPTQAIIFCVPMMIWNIGLDVEQFLHGEQSFHFHAALPKEAKIVNQGEISEIYDRGPGKGCVLEMSGTARLENGGPLVDWVARIVARGDDIKGADKKPPRPHAIPDRPPDAVGTNETRPDQALLYRLSGDRNLIHVDPVVARQSGFPRPILQGACTASFACREILRHFCDYDPALIEDFEVRWSAPLIPGDTLETQMWRDGDIVSFRCRAVERDAIVISNGRCRLRQARALSMHG